MDIEKITKNYNWGDITIGVLGGHSALDVCRGAKKLGFKTLCVAKKGREKTYDKYYKTRINCHPALDAGSRKNREDFGSSQEGQDYKGCIDDCIVVNEWKDLLNKEIQEDLRKRNTIFIHNRYFWTYFDFKDIETKFEVPIYGSRELLKLEERDIEKNQYYLLKKAGIRIPEIWQTPILEYKVSDENIQVKQKKEYKIFKTGKLSMKIDNKKYEEYLKFEKEYKEIKTKIADEHDLKIKNDLFKKFFALDELLEDYGIKYGIINKITLTKVNSAIRTYERENFIASSPKEWIQKAINKLSDGAITIEGLRKCVIEKFILGAQINFNFIHTVNGEIELLGTDIRRQTSLDGYLRLPAKEQKKIDNYDPYYIETGHVAVTCKESLLEKAFEAAERFVKACEVETGQKLIGPFALQGAIETDGKKEELVVFDVSLRIPGSPGIMATPYSGYLYGENISMGERVAMDIKEALDSGRIKDILT